MTSLEKDCKDLIKSFKGSGNTFAEFVAELFKDQFIEIYVGDAYEDVKYEQHSTTYPAVFCGKVIGAYKECLIINSVYIKNKKSSLGNIMFINERAIRALNAVDGLGSFEETILRSRETVGIAKKFGK